MSLVVGLRDTHLPRLQGQRALAAAIELLYYAIRDCGLRSDALEALITSVEAEEAEWRGQHAPPPLVIAARARWFQVRGGPVVFLDRMRAPRLLLEALARERHRWPGRAIPIDDLVARGWPDERVLRSAGVCRVYVAVAALRKLGMRRILQRAPGGYLLDPDVPILCIDAGETD